MTVAVEDAINLVIPAPFSTFLFGTFDHTDRRRALGVLGKDNLRCCQTILDSRYVKIFLLGFTFAHDQGDRSRRLPPRSASK
jgi:hypothetical protein